VRAELCQAPAAAAVRFLVPEAVVNPAMEVVNPVAVAGNTKAGAAVRIKALLPVFIANVA